MLVDLTIRKIDNGFKAVVLDVNRGSSHLLGRRFTNRNFKPFAAGSSFRAIFNLTATGKLTFKRFIVPEETSPAMTGSELIESVVKRDEPDAAMRELFEGVAVRFDKVASGTVGSSRIETIGSRRPPTVHWNDEASVSIATPKESIMNEVKDAVEGYYVSPEARLVFNTAKAMSENRPERAVKVMMVGPSGYGKTTLPKLFADLTGKRFLRMNCATIRDPEEWFGYREAKDGTTVFVPSQFGREIQEGNLVVVLDEFNRLEPWLHNTLFPLLDDDGCTVVHDEKFSIGQGVIVVGTINTGYKYTGTFELDEALFNRFDFTLEVGAMPHASEVEVLAKRVGISKADAAKITKMANILRQAEVVCSTRTTLLVASMLKAGMTLRESFESAVVRRIPVDSAGGGLRKQVIDLINPQLGVLDTRTLDKDVFSVVMEVAVKETVAKEEICEPVATGYELTLFAEKERTLLSINLIKTLRLLPTESGRLDLRDAKNLVDKIAQGETIVLRLTHKPENMEQLVAELKRIGCSGMFKKAAL
jgi:MoxR-like ATPase